MDRYNWNFEDTTKTRYKAVIKYLAFIAVLVFITFMIVGCSTSQDKARAKYKNIDCPCTTSGARIEMIGEDFICQCLE